MLSLSVVTKTTHDSGSKYQPLSFITNPCFLPALFYQVDGDTNLIW